MNLKDINGDYVREQHTSETGFFWSGFLLLGGWKLPVIVIILILFF
jgi:hypothetical protein